MSSQSHKRSSHGRGEKDESRVWKPHKDWRVWVALVLMLAAIVMYVLSLDVTIIPR